MKLWKRIDQSHNHGHIQESDKCLYAREFKKHQKGNDGDTNDLVINFKKPPKDNGQFYRNRDLKRFALELSEIFQPNSSTTITAIPSSKHKSDPEYTRRFEDCFKELQSARKNLKIEWPIEIKKTVKASHSGGSRDPDEIKENYVWKGFSGNPPEVLAVTRPSQAMCDTAENS